MSRRRNNPPAFVAGDIAECVVDWYSSVRLGQPLVVLGTHTTNGEMVIEVDNPSYARTSTYYAKNFRNLSRALPLFHQKEKPKMRKVHVVIPFHGEEPNVETIFNTLETMRVRQDGMVVADSYQNAIVQAEVLTRGGGKALVLSAIAVVEPVPSTRVRQL